MFSVPRSFSNLPGASVDLPLAFIKAGTRMSWTRVDLPEPETPAIHTTECSGMRMSKFLRLCSDAPRRTSAGLAGLMRLWAECGKVLSPRR